ncbi:MAG: hypothetical protein ABEH59_03705 [Halobacteriales archaeon]
MRRRSLLASLGGLGVASLSGCTGSGGEDTASPTPTPPEREFPYTADAEEQNVRPRDLTVDNGTKQEYEVSLAISDLEVDRTVMKRTFTLPGETERTFEDLIGKINTYAVRLELAVGTTKRYEWPIDEDHGDAHLAIQEGETPTDPVVWFSITNL